MMLARRRPSPLSIVLVAVGCLLAGCGGQLAPPPDGHAPTYVRWSVPARPFDAATEVRLELRDERIDRVGKVFDVPHPSRTLSAQERASFEQHLRRVRLVGFPLTPKVLTAGPACFVPHHFFRYYDQRGRQLGEIAVCFCCLGAEANPRLPFENGETDALSVDIPGVKSFVKSLGVPTEIQCTPGEA